MSDIRSLYRKLQLGNTSDADVTEYRGYVDQALTDPARYLAQLEYVIGSSYGLGTLKTFTERYSVPVGGYRLIRDTCAELSEKATSYGLPSTGYDTWIEYCDDYIGSHERLFVAYEHYGDKLPSDYFSRYYGFNESTDPTLVLRSIGAGALPDMIVRYPDRVQVAVEANQVLFSSVRDREILFYLSESFPIIIGDSMDAKQSLVSKIKRIHDRNQATFREAVIMDREPEYVYSTEDTEIITAYIEYLEYMVTASVSQSESERFSSVLYETYTAFSPLLEEMESSADIAMLLPGPYRYSGDITEGYGSSKKGTVPGYISKNHDMSNYGEVDPIPKKTDKDPDETLDEPDKKVPKKDDTDFMLDDPTDTTKDDDKKDDRKDDDKKDDKKGNVYYYNYYNSLNTHTRSSDDHSVNKRTSDDHSVNKTDNRSGTPRKKKDTLNDDEDELDESVFDTDTLLDTYGEGVWDSIKSTAKGIVSKIKSIVGMKRTLPNLQQMDAYLMNPTGRKMCIPGTSIPIENSTPKKESNTVLFPDSGTVPLTESNDDYYGLPKNYIKRVVERLRKKFNAQIIFLNPDADPQIVSRVGPAAVVPMNKETMIALNKGTNFSDSTDTDNLENLSNYTKYILVNTRVISQMGIKTAEGIEAIVSHEYGHVLTFDRLTMDDWVEYTCKVQMITDLFTKYCPQTPQQCANLQSYYWKFKPEALANEAVGLSPGKLCQVIFNTEFQEIKEFDVDAIRTLKLPSLAMEVTRMSMENRTIPPDKLEAQRKWAAEFYQKVIRVEKKKDLVAALFGGIDISKAKSVNASDILKESYQFTEADDDPEKPESDHPVRDTLSDIDRNLANVTAKIKKGAGNVVNAGKVAAKPVQKVGSTVDNMIARFRDSSENNIKEKMADPHQRKSLYGLIRKLIVGGSLLRAGVLLNPIFLALSGYRKLGKHKREQRIRFEMMNELKQEIEIIDEKINDANSSGDKAAKYKLMRFKNELQKKMFRVGAGDRKAAAAI